MNPDLVNPIDYRFCRSSTYGSGGTTDFTATEKYYDGNTSIYTVAEKAAKENNLRDGEVFALSWRNGSGFRIFKAEAKIKVTEVSNF